MDAEWRRRRTAAFRAARGMRSSLTPQEARVWAELKRLRARGIHFRRQAPFRGYFLDFVCFSRRLVIEIDGGQHGEDAQAAHDALRDAVLERERFETLRFWNLDVSQNLDAVMQTIMTALGPRSPLGTDGPSRWAGE